MKEVAVIIAIFLPVCLGEQKCLYGLDRNYSINGPRLPKRKAYFSLPRDIIEQENYPYLVGVSVYQNHAIFDYWLYCLGTMITETKLITVASCLNHTTDTKKVLITGGDISYFYVYQELREMNYHYNLQETEFIQEVPVKSIRYHPKFNDKLCENDIVVIEIAKEFRSDLKVRTAKLNFDYKNKTMNCSTVGLSLASDFFMITSMINIKFSTPELGCKKKTKGNYLCTEADYHLNCMCDSGSIAICKKEVYGIASHYLYLDPQKESEGSEHYFLDLHFYKDFIESAENESTSGTVKSLLSPVVPLLCCFFGILSLLKKNLHSNVKK